MKSSWELLRRKLRLRLRQVSPRSPRCTISLNDSRCVIERRLWIDDSRIIAVGTIGSSSISSSSMGVRSPLLAQSFTFSSTYFSNSSCTLLLQLRSSSSTVFLERMMSSSLNSLFMFLGLNLKFFLIFSTHSWYILSQSLVMSSLILKSKIWMSSLRYSFTTQPISSSDICIFFPQLSALSLGLSPTQPSMQGFRQVSITFHFISCRVAPRNRIYSSFSSRIFVISMRMRQSSTPSMCGSVLPFSVSFWIMQWASQVNSPLLCRSTSSWYLSLDCRFLLFLITGREFIPLFWLLLLCLSFRSFTNTNPMGQYNQYKHKHKRATQTQKQTFSINIQHNDATQTQTFRINIQHKHSGQTFRIMMQYKIKSLSFDLHLLLLLLLHPLHGLAPHALDGEDAFCVAVAELRQELLNHVHHALSVQRKFMAHQQPASALRQRRQQNQLVLVMLVQAHLLLHQSPQPNQNYLFRHLLPDCPHIPHHSVPQAQASDTVIIFRQEHLLHLELNFHLLLWEGGLQNVPHLVFEVVGCGGELASLHIVLDEDPVGRAKVDEGDGLDWRCRLHVEDDKAVAFRVVSLLDFLNVQIHPHPNHERPKTLLNALQAGRS